MNTEVCRQWSKKGDLAHCAVYRSAFSVTKRCAFSLLPFLAAFPLFAQSHWKKTGAVERLVVMKQEDPFFLVNLPATTTNQPVASVRAFVVSNEVPVRVIAASKTKGVTVLVGAGAARRGQRIEIYPIPGKSLVSPGPGVQDPHPIRGIAARTAGMDIPENYEMMRRLESRFDRKPIPFYCASFDKLKDTFKSWFRGDWTRKNHWVELQSWIWVPKQTELVFGLAGVAPAWLFLDDKMVMSHAAGQTYDKWSEGKPFKLPAGLHPLRVQTVCRQMIDTGVAWKEKNAATLATNVVMITGGDMRTGRWERRTERVHPYAEATYGRGYRFAGVDGCFVPISLEGMGVSWEGKATHLWKIAGHPVGTDRDVSVTLHTTNLPATATLEMVSPKGTRRSFSFPLVYDAPAAAEVYLTSRVTGIPSFCTEGDVVRPLIRIRTSAADGLRYSIAAKTFHRDGSVTTQTESAVTDQGWARIYLAPCAVNDCERLEWTVLHADVALDKGTLRFLHTPYPLLPDAVSGELLKAGKTFLLPITPRASCGPLKNPSTEMDNLLLLEEGTAPELSLGKGADIIHTEELQRGESASGIRLLRPFLALQSIPKNKRILYLPAVQEMDLHNPARFAQRVAAAVAFLRAPAIAAKEVLLGIPPPQDTLLDCGCPPAKAPCPHAAKIRQFAEAVMRVADTTGLRCVDFYTAFQATETPMDGTMNGRLTPTGMNWIKESLQRQ